MHVDPHAIVTLVAALGSALVAGVFFAFSSFVMDGLAALPAEQGIAAMQSINVTAVRRLFMSAFLGTALTCAALVVWSLLRWGEPHAMHELVGAALYLVGSFGVTIACNVPRNQVLADLDARANDSAREWSRYLVGWTRWNHVRTVAALAAAAVLVLALVGGAR